MPSQRMVARTSSGEFEHGHLNLSKGTASALVAVYNHRHTMVSGCARILSIRKTRP